MTGRSEILKKLSRDIEIAHKKLEDSLKLRKLAKMETISRVKALEKRAIELAKLTNVNAIHSKENEAIEAQICSLLAEIHDKKQSVSQMKRQKAHVLIQREKWWRQVSLVNDILNNFNASLEKEAGKLQSEINQKVAQLKKIRSSIGADAKSE